MSARFREAFSKTRRRKRFIGLKKNGTGNTTYIKGKISLNRLILPDFKLFTL
jgi:hypothetical protein